VGPAGRAVVVDQAPVSRDRVAAAEAAADKAATAEAAAHRAEAVAARVAEAGHYPTIRRRWNQVTEAAAEVRAAEAANRASFSARILASLWSISSRYSAGLRYLSGELFCADSCAWPPYALCAARLSDEQVFAALHFGRCAPSRCGFHFQRDVNRRLAKQGRYCTGCQREQQRPITFPDSSIPPSAGGLRPLEFSIQVATPGPTCNYKSVSGLAPETAQMAGHLLTGVGRPVTTWVRIP